MQWKNQEWVSMADDEERERVFKEKQDEIREIRARRKGQRFFVKGISPLDLLKQNGYKMQSNGSLARMIDRTFRYHAYITQADEIEIHADLVQMNAIGMWHKATNHGVQEEIKRLRNAMPVREYVHKKSKTEILRFDLMKKAMEDLKNKQQLQTQ